MLPIALVSLAGVACEYLPRRAAPHPARLVAGRGDTVVINSPRATLLPIRAVDSAGNVLPVVGARYSWLSGEPIPVSDSGRVTCTRRLDAVVRVSLGDRDRRFFLLCRPVRRFTVTSDPTHGPLIVGGAPLPLVVHAIGLDGAPVTETAGTITVEDTAIAVVRHDSLHARRPGMTGFAVDLGVCVLAVGLEVDERVATPSALRRREQVFLDTPTGLSQAARREWALPPGEYRLALLPGRGGPELELRTTGMNCVAEMGLHCIALANASVTVRRPHPHAQWVEHGGTLKVQRLDVPKFPGATAAAQDLRWVGSANPECPLPR